MPEFIAHTTDSTAGRTGAGRWSVVMTPCPGILWTNDLDTIGFLPVGQVDDTIFDSTNIDEQIQANVDAGRTATECFELISAMVGKSIHSGDLTTWRAKPVRPKLRVPDITRGEVMDAAKADADTHLTTLVSAVSDQITAQLDDLMTAVQDGRRIRFEIDDEDDQ